MIDKYFYDPEEGSTVLDSKGYNSYSVNRMKVGFSISYGIRNHTNENIHVRSRGGYSQIIVPCPDVGSSDVERLYEDYNVWIDIKFRLGSLRDSAYTKSNYNNTIDKIIAEEIDKRVSYAISKSLVPDESFECEFSISLKNIIPNFKSMGFHSETLGIIIELDPRSRVKDWLGEIVNESECLYQEDFQTKLLDIRTSTYQFVHLIDNRGEVGNLWILQSGIPKIIRGLKNQSVDSGLYIFDNQYSTKTKPYTFIPSNEICDKVLREYGIGRTESEILNGSRTKDYNDLKAEKDKLQKTLSECKVTIIKKDEEISKLERKIFQLNIEIQKEKTTIETMKEDAKRIGRLESFGKTLMADIDKKTEEHFKLNGNKNTDNIGTIGSAFKTMGEGLKILKFFIA